MPTIKTGPAVQVVDATPQTITDRALVRLLPWDLGRVARVDGGDARRELHRNPAANGGHWKGLDDLEFATGGGVGWFNEERLHGVLDDATRQSSKPTTTVASLRPNAA